MNMTQASLIVVAAASGQLIGVNAYMERENKDGMSYEHGPRAEAAAAIALTAVANFLGEQPGEPMENEPTLRPISGGQINVYSKPGGLAAIPGYHDHVFELPLKLKQA